MTTADFERLDIEMDRAFSIFEILTFDALSPNFPVKTNVMDFLIKPKVTCKKIIAMFAKDALYRYSNMSNYKTICQKYLIDLHFLHSQSYSQ